MTPVSSDRWALPKYGPVVFPNLKSRSGPRRNRDGTRGKYLRVTCEAHASPALLQSVTLPIRPKPKWQGMGVWESEGIIVLVTGRIT